MGAAASDYPILSYYYCCEDKKESDLVFEQLMDTIQRESLAEQNKMSFSARFSASLKSREGISLRTPVSSKSGRNREIRLGQQ